jgi:type IV secretion system protein TrbI
MSNTTSPAVLQPRPKRAPGVKRLNAVPKAIGFGVLILFCGGVVYTAVQRSHQSKIEAAKDADAKKVEGGKAPAFLNAAQSHGEVQAALDRQLSRPDSTSSASASTPATTPATTAQPVIIDPSGSDIAEQARARAWQAYFQQRDALQARRFEMDMRALTGSDAQQGSGQSYGGTQGVSGAGGPALPTTQVAASGGAPGGSYTTGGTDPSGQTGKQAFLRTPGDPYGLDENQPGSVHGPKPDTLMQGTAIPARLIDGATSDMPGQITGEVMRNVCDTMTGQDLLIPQGTRLEGTYDISVSAGQDRLGVIWNRLVFPDTSSRQIGSQEGADQAGYAGFKDQVNTHFWDKFGSALMISIAGAGAQLAQPQQSAFSTYNPGSVATGALTQQMSQLGQAYAQRGLSIPNTIQIRPGYVFTVKLNRDLPLPSYVDQRGFTNGTGPCT